MYPFTVVSILTSKPIIERCHQEGMDQTQTNECSIEVMSSIVFLTGLIMLCLGLFRLGALNALLTGM